MDVSTEKQEKLDPRVERLLQLIVEARRARRRAELSLTPAIPQFDKK